MQQELRKEGASSLLLDIATTYYLKGSRCEQNVTIGSVSGVVRDHVNDCEHTRILRALVEHPQGNLEEIQRKLYRALKRNLEVVRTARPGRTPLDAP